MFALRLARLVLAPGALPYALLTFVVALIWLGAGTRPAHAPTTADSVGSGDTAAGASRGTLSSSTPIPASYSPVESRVTSRRSKVGEDDALRTPGLRLVTCDYRGRRDRR